MSKNEITATDHAFLESVSDVLLQARKMRKLQLISRWYMLIMK